MSKLYRRNFLALTVGATTAALLSQCDRNPANRSYPPGQLKSASAVTLPTVYTSQAGLLEVSLEARYETVNLGNRLAYLLTYNGQVPGPRLEANPGDTVRIQFTNQLTQPTNLHYHGLHIPPTGTGDNAFREVSPGETVTYEFTLPANHRAGTFWYHPHWHGLVAEQLFGGLAGLFIVRGDLDNFPEVQAAQEEFLVIKDFALDANGNISPPGHMAQMTGRIGGLLTASGQVNPTLQLATPGLLRLRLLNAASSRFLRLSLEGHPLYLIATDGGAISAPLELEELFLAPGERAEVLVKCDRNPGQYRLLNTPYNPAQGMMGGGMMGRGDMMGGERIRNANTSTRTETVATISYQTTGEDIFLPPQLIAIDPLPEPQTTRRFELNHGMGNGMVFLINGQAFDHHRVDTQVKIGSVEDWEIINTGTMAHPFHVHVNKFQVIARNGQPVDSLAWKDVVSVAPGETVRIRIPFRDYTGKTVYHCHVLDHEDRGMMGILDIQT